MGWLLSKTDYTSKGTNLYVTTPYFHRTAASSAVRSAHELSLLKFYTLGDDTENIRQRRRPENRIGFALQLCALRYPGRALALVMIPREVLSFVGAQLEFRLMRFSLMPHGAKPVSSTWTRCAKFTATRPSRAVVPVICSGLSAGRRCQIKRGSCSSFYCAVSGNFHHSARSIDNRALVRGCSGRR